MESLSCPPSQADPILVASHAEPTERDEQYISENISVEYIEFWKEPLPPQIIPEYQLISNLKSKSTPLYAGAESSCLVRLCIVKVPVVRVTDTTDAQPSSPGELAFLRGVKPVHANIVRYFDTTENFIFMELYPLGSLDQYLVRKLSVPVVDWAIQLCNALVYIHGLGWAHNQLNPSNILVANDGSQLKICDFSKVTAIFSEAEPGDKRRRGDLLDVFCLGTFVWFIQHEEKSIFPGIWGVDDTSYAERPPLDVSGLELINTMRLCWSHPSVRPSAATLRRQLDSENLKEKSVRAVFGERNHVDRTEASAPNEVRLGQGSGPFSASFKSNIRLGIVKTPRIYEGPDSASLSRLSLEAFYNEHEFLQSIQPQHQNIIRYLAITESYIFAEHYPLGSLERYLTPEIKPPVFNWTMQLCSALAYLHGLDYAHNQLWPCNVLVGSGGSKLLICDFSTVTPAEDYDGGDFPSAPELAITMHQTLADVQERRGDAADVYSLGLLTWFMQHGGREIPHNYVWIDPSGEGTLSVDQIHSHLDMLDVSGLELADFMRECWAPYASRPTSRVLVERLRAMQQNDSRTYGDSSMSR